MDSSPVVLIVEDEFLLRAAAVDMGEAAGFVVLEASDADQAIRILERRPDVRAVFTDINMPGSIDGLKLARVIRDRWPPVELIVTSGNATPPAHELPERFRSVPKPHVHSELNGLFQSLVQRMTGYVERGSKYWQDRAEEARARAAEMRDASAVLTMSEIACLYDQMAKRAADREAMERRSI